MRTGPADDGAGLGDQLDGRIKGNVTAAAVVNDQIRQLARLGVPFLAIGTMVGRTEEEVAAVLAKGRPTVEAKSRDDWSKATPLPVSRLAVLPPFPVDVLPEPFAAMVVEVARFTQTDETMAGVSVLAVLAACAGGRVEVEARPGWREPCNLFTATVARPGERKSAVQAVLTGPLLDAERDLINAAGPLVLKAQTEQDVAKKSAERARNAAASAETELKGGALSDAVTAAMLAEAVVVPTMPRILADDITPEAAASLLAEQSGRLAIISAEGGIFDIIGGRYSNGIANLDVWLKGHAGDRLRIDRKGRPAEFVDRPALTVALMVQPAVLATVARNPVMRGRGLLARFLYAFPVSKVGYRQVDPDPVSPGIETAYGAAVRGLAITLAGWTDPAVVVLTDAAVALLLDLSRRTEARLRTGGDLAHLADWANKLSGAAVRMAGLLHLGKHPEDGWRLQVEASSMVGAVRLAEFFTGHAIAAFDAMAADPVTADAARILDVLRSKELPEFSVRDLRRTHMRGRTSGEDIGPALALLTELGWIWQEPPPETKGGGRRPSPIYSVHLSLFLAS